MAWSITGINPGAENLGRQRHVPIKIIPDASYLPDGESLRVDGSPISTRERILGVQWIGGNAASGRVKPHYDVASEKVLLFRALAGDLVQYAQGDIKGATNLAGTEGAADQNATAVNGALLMAKATITSLAGTATPTVQPDFPRNVLLQIENDSGGALALYEGTSVFTITGTDTEGAALTETVNWTSTAGNKSIADTKFRFIQSTKAFRTVTSVTYTNAPAGGLKLSLGIGSRVGLPRALETAAHTDVDTFSVNAARTATSTTLTSAGGVDTTNNVVNIGTTANGDDFFVQYSGAAQQVISGSDQSACEFRAIAITY